MEQDKKKNPKKPIVSSSKVNKRNMMVHEKER